jgi:hypothetical protein
MPGRHVRPSGIAQTIKDQAEKAIIAPAGTKV